MSTAKSVLKVLMPPLLWRQMQSARQMTKRLSYGRRTNDSKAGPVAQDIGVYFDPHMAQQLEEWGEGTTWNEIQFLVAGVRGKVLDIACGTGKTVHLNSKFKNLEIHGNDISPFLIDKAVQRGLPKDRVVVCDATDMRIYPDFFFDFAYSIGSLEHFTESGISAVMRECKRIVRYASFHFVPIPRDGKDHGWIATYQSFHSNSVDWWLAKCEGTCESVYVLDSSWAVGNMIGKWLICISQ